MHGASSAFAVEGGQARGAVEPTSVVLELTKRGREELEQPRFDLHGHQRRLLEQFDGRRGGRMWRSRRWPRSCRVERGRSFA
jgi:hypothetical protein